MDVDASDSLKSTLILESSPIEKSAMTDYISISTEIDFDEDDLSHSSIQSKKRSTARFVKKRSSPVLVYTYKVVSSSLRFHSFIFRNYRITLYFRS